MQKLLRLELMMMMMMKKGHNELFKHTIFFNPLGKIIATQKKLSQAYSGLTVSGGRCTVKRFERQT